MQTEQLQPPVTDDSKYGYAVPVFMDKEEFGFRMFCVSDGTKKLDDLFGLDMHKPFETTADSKNKLKLATTFFAGSFESSKVVHFFATLAEGANHFMAFPADEIVAGSYGRIQELDLLKATEDGYLRRTVFSGTDVELVELTTKFGHMYETVQGLSSIPLTTE